MKKVLWVIILLFGLGIIAECMNTPSKQRMNEELKKPEVVKLIDEAIKGLGLTPKSENLIKTP